MKTEKKETKVDEPRRIILKSNNAITNDPCAICGARCDPDGFDFFLEGTESLVCSDCARQNVPDIFQLWRDLHLWLEGEIGSIRKEALDEGKRQAGEIILAAIEESPIDRVKRICSGELGVSKEYEDMPVFGEV